MLSKYRNRNADKSTGTSATAKFYAANPKSKARHRAYSKSESQKNSKKRTILGKLRRNSKSAKVGDGKDMAHQPNGTVKLQSASINRGGKSMPGDKRARGGYIKKKRK